MHDNVPQFQTAYDTWSYNNGPSYYLCNNVMKMVHFNNEITNRRKCFLRILRSWINVFYLRWDLEWMETFHSQTHWGKADDRNCNYGHPKMADLESGKNLFCRLNCFYINDTCLSTIIIYELSTRKSQITTEKCIWKRKSDLKKSLRWPELIIILFCYYGHLGDF